MKKIAVICQRYGLEVNGGAELYARVLAEQLSPYYEVEVLTTCAVDYTTWENFYPIGIHDVNGLPIRRFPVDCPRNPERFREVSEKMFADERGNREYEELWIDEQGPYSSEFLRYLSENKDTYDVFLFVTYLYYLTVRGIGLVSDKSILIPTAHDEPPIYLDVYRDVFTAPRYLVFNTEEERDFVYGLFRNLQTPGGVFGLGIETPKGIDPQRFREKFGLSNYVVYVGRIDESKNCKVLFEDFLRYKERNPSSLKLILMGKAVMEVPKHPDIVPLGFVSDEDKFDGMAGAKLLLLPSAFESLSLVVLESLALGVPVIVNGGCTVLKGHCQKSNAGLYYHNFYEFEGGLNYLFEHLEAYTALGQNGKQYIAKNYRWEVIIGKFRGMIDTFIDG